MAELARSLSAEDARVLTDRIKVGVEAVWDLVRDAYLCRVWDVLGYASWDDYCTREFGAARLRLPREERAEVVASLRESGLSLRAIAAATGYSEPTVRRELSGASFDAPGEPEVDGDAPAEELAAGSLRRGLEEFASGQRVPTDWLADDAAQLPAVTGLDGKTYTPRPAAPATRRRALTDQARDAGWNLRKSVERIERLAADDRFDAQAKKMAPHLQGHLTNAVDVCQRILDRLNREITS